MMKRRGRSRPDDAERLHQLLEEHHEAFLRFFARRVEPGIVDDGAAAVFETAWRRIGDVPEGPAARAWLYGVARNTVRHQQRTWSRQQRLVDRLAAATGAPRQLDPADEVAASDRIARAAAALRPADRELLEPISWEQLGPTELAAVLGCSVNAATIRVHRMRAALSRQLETDNESQEMTR